MFFSSLHSQHFHVPKLTVWKIDFELDLFLSEREMSQMVEENGT